MADDTQATQPTAAERFYLDCKQTLDSAKRGQYNADNGYPNGFTSQDMRKLLGDTAMTIDSNFGPASGSPFSMGADPGVETMNLYIDQAAAKYQAWLDAGSPQELS